MIIPEWICNDLDDDNNFYYSVRSIISKHYKNIEIIYPDKGTSMMLEDDKDKSKLTLRADILPQKREIFISLMKDSVNDILVTGDQSLTDIISCCKYKRVWYQIAPWKMDFSENLFKQLPNNNLKTFKTSCGTLKSANMNIDWKNFMKLYDFRINGKKRFDSILKGHEQMNKGRYLKELLEIINHSRYLETAVKKINNLK